MIALQIKHCKDFMNKLLLQDTFGRFLVSEASITTFAAFSIDGELRPDFFESEKAAQVRETGRRQVLWSEIRPFCLSVIRGKRTPLSVKFIFQLPTEEVALLTAKSSPDLSADDVFGLYLNCQYNGETLTLTTGSSLRLFTMDKSLDMAWDQMLLEFLRLQDLD